MQKIYIYKKEFLRRFLMIAPLVKMLKNSFAAVVTVSMLLDFFLFSYEEIFYLNVTSIKS